MVADILDRFQIVAKKDLFPNQLSGGQQQLVGIARAVVHAPSLLLADEPTGNLHSTQAREIMELFRELNREGTTIVQVTHSEENARYGKRIVELRDGWLTRDENLQAAFNGGRRTSEIFHDNFDRIVSARVSRPSPQFFCCRSTWLSPWSRRRAKAAPANSQATLPAPEAPAPATTATAAAPISLAQQMQQDSAKRLPRNDHFTWNCRTRTSRSHPTGPAMAPPLDLTNSPRLQNLIRDGKLYISLHDAIALAIENNLDLAYFRYNFPIAQTDYARTKAGGARAMASNTAIVQSSTQGGFSGGGAVAEAPVPGRLLRARAAS